MYMSIFLMRKLHLYVQKKKKKKKYAVKMILTKFGIVKGHNSNSFFLQIN